MKKTIDDLKNISGKKVLMRCDFNVPILDGIITDTTRINAGLKSIKKLISLNAKIILCSHLGKPKAQEEKFSLEIIANKLAELLNKKILFSRDKNITGQETQNKIKELKDGEIILLENTRFRPEETKNLDNFSQELANLADIYINDAFGSAHRAHCSTCGVAKFIKQSAIGYLIQEEIKFLGNALEQPDNLVAILGGAKISDKINVIDNLLNKVNKLIIGGGMAYTFLKAQGYEIGNSLLEEDKINFALDMIKKAKEKNIKLILPVDIVVIKNFDDTKNYKTVKFDQIPKDLMGVDIGEETREIFKKNLEDAKTIIWNGPMGVFEIKEFAQGTFAIAQALSNLKDSISIVGGGDSVAAIKQLGFENNITHISTGGGATLEFLEGKELPGIAAIENKN